MHQAAPGPKPRLTLGTIGGGPTGKAPPEAPAAPEELDAVYDTLTDLFLGEGCLAPAQIAVPVPSEPPAHEPKARPGPALEALVLGHLPVLASAWVGQYAKHVAQTSGQPVALLRVRAGSVALDLIGGTSGSASAREPLATLDEALREGAAHTDRWVLSVEATSEPRLAAMLGAAGIDTLTLLTGADEAAVVACYRTIKSLLGKRRTGDDPDDTGAASIQLGVMGASPERAEEAGQKLSHATETFLGQRPKIVACVSKIGGSVSRPLYRGTDERAVEELVGVIRGLSWVKRAKPPFISGEPQVVHRMPSPGPVPPPPRVASVAPQTTPTMGRIGIPMPESPGAGTSETGVLAAHVPGLAPIAFRCPYVGRVELAMSADGRMHLLARAEHGYGLGSAAAHLAGAAAWAKAHSDLLTAACPGLSLNAGAASPISHLFTDHAPEARSVLDSEIRVHLLAEARVSGNGAHICVDLN
jgi:hypothetical protein